MTKVRAMLASLRPKQWIKNGFVATPALFGHQLGDPEEVLRVLAGVGCFCAASGGLYLFNDVVDRENDRRHPEKRNRPIAAGLIDVRSALIAAAALVILALAAGLALEPLFFVTLAGYCGLTVLYTFVLKHEVILDVMSIAAGFVLRVLAGAAIVDVRPSVWILICTGLLAILLGFAKRRHETITLSGDRATHRQVLADYSVSFLDAMIIISAGMTLAAYAVYTATGEPGTHHLAATLPFVLYGVFRYLWLVYHRHEGGNPTELVWSDRGLMITVALWLVTAAALLAN